MNDSGDFLKRITEEVLAEMPHVAKVMHYRTTDSTWWLLAQTTGGAEVLGHQQSVNQLMRNMVIEDITKIRTDYEFRQHTHDPASENYQEATLALQVIEDYGSKASLVIARRQAAIQEALEKAHTLQINQSRLDLCYCASGC